MSDVSNPTPAPEAKPVRPTFAEAWRFWLKLGFISFGGPAGQIAIMHEEVVERRKWVDDARFMHAWNFCTLLPGPEAQQLATYLGWLLHGTWGGIVAGVLFVLPAAVLLWVLSWVYVTYGSVSWVAALFAGLKPAVVAIVAVAVWKIGKKALGNAPRWMLAAAAFGALFFLKAPFPLVIAVAAWIGLRFQNAFQSTSKKDDPALLEAAARPTWGQSLRVLLTWLALWWVPVGALALWLGTANVLVDQGVFFSKTAVVTFGGAYAVLPYVAQQAVEQQWVTAPQMLDGLGLAESTPGPLIMVLQFVGFLGAWVQADPLGPLSPLQSATLGAFITTWVTFVPCFLWILLGAPYVEGLRQNKPIACMLGAITAAVVGVVLNLAIWFAGQVLLPAATGQGGLLPIGWTGHGLNLFALLTALTLGAAMIRFKWEVTRVVVAGAAAGLVYKLIGF